MNDDNATLRRRRALQLGLCGLALGLAGCDDRRPRERSVREILTEVPPGEMLDLLARRLREGLSPAALVEAMHALALADVVPARTFRGPHHILLCLHPVLAVRGLVRSERERDLPLLWAAAFLRDAREQPDRPSMAPLEASTLPSASAAAGELTRALEEFDATRADRAAAVMARSHQTAALEQTLLRFGSHDFREIGHKMIHAVQGTGAVLPGPDAELAYRSIALTLTLRDDAVGYDPDGTWARAQGFAARDLPDGRYHDEAVRALLGVLRMASPADALDAALAWRERGASADAIFDAVSLFCAELMFNHPTGVEAMHAVTSAEADRAAHRRLERPADRTLNLLQAVARSVTFRDYAGYHALRLGRPAASSMRIEALEPAALVPGGIEAIVASLGASSIDERARSAAQTLRFASEPGAGERLIDASAREVPTRVANVHDFKLTIAVKEEYGRIAEAWRPRYLAACSSRLCGSARPRWTLADRLMHP
jgi:hypothetical protein